MAIYEKFGSVYVDASRIFKVEIEREWCCIDISLRNGDLEARVRNPLIVDKKLSELLLSQCEEVHKEIRECMKKYKNEIRQLQDKYKPGGSNSGLYYALNECWYEYHFKPVWNADNQQFEPDIGKLKEIIDKKIPDELKPQLWCMVETTANTIRGIHSKINLSAICVGRVKYFAKDETQKMNFSVYTGSWKEIKLAEKEAEEWIAGIESA